MTNIKIYQTLKTPPHTQDTHTPAFVTPVVDHRLESELIHGQTVKDKYKNIPNTENTTPHTAYVTPVVDHWLESELIHGWHT